MGFFAVVRDPDQHFSILACHLNLWSLAGFLRRAFFLDVGLRIKVSADKDLSKFYLALPFGTEDKIYGSERGLKDLKSEILNPDIAKLVFGGQVEVIGSQIKTDDFCCETVSISTIESKRDTERSGSSYSYWCICPSQPIVKNTEAYIRIRFHIFNLGRTWIWKTSNLGAIVDFRVADIREAIAVDTWKDFTERVQPIQSLNLFVIAPASLQRSAVSPEIRYIRLLEGKVWEHYLKRKTDLFGLEKLVIYYWKHKSDFLANTDNSSPLQVGLDTTTNQTISLSKGERPIDTTNPYRAFLDLSRETSRPRRSSLIVNFIVMTLAVLAANGIRDSFPHIKQSVADSIDWTQRKLALISIAAIPVIIKYINEKYGFIRKTYPFLIKLARWIEDKIYRVN